MYKGFNIILYPINLLFVLFIYIYKVSISPILPKSCTYTPSCSTYALHSIKRFGPVKGVFLSIKRVTRCNHISKGGEDYCPDNVKGEVKWII